MAFCRLLTAGLMMAGLLLGACATGLPALSPEEVEKLAHEVPGFKAVQRAESAPLASKADLALLEEAPDAEYRIGRGDAVRIDVYGRQEVSGRFLVGPDGRITLPLLGPVLLADLTRDEAVTALNRKLRTYYTYPQATVGVEDYVSNQVTVLGRVEHAGVQRFAQPPTLAEVLANAGAMPILDKTATLTRCSIVRGRDKLIWVDLKSMLNGDLAYNIRMKKGDLVFIPDSSETAVHVLGAVGKPGAYRLTPRMTLLDAISQAGGPTENANPSRVGVYRPGAKQVEVFDLAALIDPTRKVNFGLEDGDVVFVPNNFTADIGYVMRQLAPAVSVLTFGMTLQSIKP
jgi:polysaccharide export outer membrane protein